MPFNNEQKQALTLLHRQQKALMRLERQQIGGRAAPCDYCGVEYVGLDKHEIVSKGRTTTSYEARALSEEPILSSLLCRSCHEKAHGPDVRIQLLTWNVWWIGRHITQIRAYGKMKETLANIAHYVTLDIVLPSRIPAMTDAIIQATGGSIVSFPASNIDIEILNR